MMNEKKTLVLDSSFMPRSIVSVERGFVIYYKGNADIVEAYPSNFKTQRTDIVYPKPSVIRINRFVNMKYKRVPLSRVNVYRRDGWKCVYCERDNPNQLTLDHVIPKSKGGKDRWDNLVTCCFDCNQRKGNLTVEEWGKDEPKPQQPHYLMLLKTTKEIPNEWKKYLLF